MQLQSITAVSAEHDEIRDAFRDCCCEIGPDDLLWCLLPQIEMTFLEELFQDLSSARRSGRAVATGSSDVKNIVRGIVPSSGPRLVRTSGVLTVSTSRQHLRVLQPLERALASAAGDVARATQAKPLGATASLHAIRAAAGLYRSLDVSMRRLGWRLPETIYSVLTETAITLARARSTLKSEQFSALVVASQHTPATRAWLAAAFGRGLVTIYIPHAPTATNAAYRDLPVDLALLRGPSEVEFYAGLGARRNALKIVGDASTESSRLVGGDKSGVVIYAPSPHDRGLFRSQVDTIYAAGLRNVEVCLHPRMKESDVRSDLPSCWRLSTSRLTFDRLKLGGVAVVIQCSSGVGLEALYLGIPVVDLRHPGQLAAYPYLQDCAVPSAGDSATLLACLENLDYGRTATKNRRVLASRWRASVGGAAAASMAASVRGWHGGANGRLVDGWSSYSGRRS